MLPRRVLAHLDRRRGDSGDGPAVLLERREVADDEDGRLPGNRQVRRHAHAAGPVERRAERARERRGLHAGRPHDGARGEAVAPDLDPARRPRR